MRGWRSLCVIYSIYTSRRSPYSKSCLHPLSVLVIVLNHTAYLRGLFYRMLIWLPVLRHSRLAYKQLWHPSNCIASGLRIPQRTTAPSAADEMHYSRTVRCYGDKRRTWRHRTVSSFVRQVYGFGHKLRKLASPDVELLGLAWRFNTASPPLAVRCLHVCTVPQHPATRCPPPPLPFTNGPWVVSSWWLCIGLSLHSFIETCQFLSLFGRLKPRAHKSAGRTELQWSRLTVWR